MTAPTWQFLDGRLSLVFKSDNDCAYELAADWAPSLPDRDRALATALLRLALKQLEGE